MESKYSIEKKSIQERLDKIKILIQEMDRKQDDSNLSDAEFDSLENEIRILLSEDSKLNNRLQLLNAKEIIKVNDWTRNFLESFAGNHTRKITIKQAQIFEKINQGKPFIFNGMRYDCGKPNYKIGFNSLIVTIL